MANISFPLKQGQKGAAVANLQDALQALLDRKMILPNDEPARQELAVALKAEREKSAYGSITSKLVLAFQAERALEQHGEIDEATANALNKLLQQSEPSTGDTGATVEGTATGGQVGTPGGDGKDGPYRVYGTIALEHGLPAANIKLRLYQRGFGATKAPLRDGQTDSKGAYDIRYTPSGVQNVELYAVGPDGKEVQLSRTIFRAQKEERLDLVAPAMLQPPDTEFSRLTAAVAPYLGNKPGSLKDAVERGDRQDISVLASSTGWDGRLLALASIAYENADTTAIPVEALYALYRAGLPTDTSALARVDRDVIETALNKGVQSGIIGAAVVEPGITAFGDLVATERLNFKSPGKLSSISAFVTRASISAADRDAFTSVLKEGKAENLWARATAAGVSKQGIVNLQLQGKLAYLTLNNAELVADLQPKLTTGDARQLIELDFDQSVKWNSEISALAGGSDARLDRLIPPAFTGRDNQERLGAYCDELARRVRQMDPNRVTMRQLARGDLDGIDTGARAGVQLFLNNASAKGFRLGQTAMSSFVKGQEVALLPGMSETERKLALNEVKSMHRLYSVSTSDKTLNVLRKKGFKSAFDITRLSYEDFYQYVGPEIGTTRETQQIYWKAQQQSATIINVFSGAKQLGVAPSMDSIGGRPLDRGGRIAKAKEKLKGQFPTLEALFGNVDYCECEQCNSVLSPAAYLVDILHFIDPKDCQWTSVKSNWAATQTDPTKDYEKDYKKPFDALFARRRDISKILLTCENTNTAMPYIDIVNEILELLVAGGDYSALEAFDTGSAASADLIAEPQNITWQAYIGGNGKIGLNESVYPVTLPFDLPIEMVRAFCKQLDVPLWKLRELLARPNKLQATTGTADGLTDVWFERLGLGPADVKVLVGDHSWYTLYGYANEADALEGLTDGQGARDPATGLRSAKTLARRLNVTYKELVELVKTGFVNPALDGLVVLHKLEIDPHDVERYFNPPQKGALTPAERSAFEASLKRLRLKPDEVKGLWSDAIREKVLLLRSPEIGCDFSATTLEFAKTPTNVSAAMALALFKMNVFVRLQRKLGWSTQVLDSALRVFVRPSVAALSIAGWKDAMRTALMYLAHLDEIAERIGNRVTHEELLTLWAPIPTTGIPSLYERMFLNRGILAQDPVFDNALGRYLEDSSEHVSDHLDAVRQALQVSHEEVEQIFAHIGVANPKLSIDSLSILMRHKVLATALEMSMADLLTLLSLSRTTPMKGLAAGAVQAVEEDVPFSETVAFLREVELLRDAGLGPDAVEGICRQRGNSIDADAWAKLADRVLLALSTLPKTPGATAGSDPNELKRVEDAKQRERLAVMQSLAAQLGAEEPMITALVSNVLTDPAVGKPLIEGGLASRLGQLAGEGTTWSSYVWFSAGGSYKVSIPSGVTATLKFGPDNDLQPLTANAGAFELAEIHAGQRYRIELTFSAKATLAIQGDAIPTAIPVEEYSRFASSVLRLRKALDMLGALGITDAELAYLRSMPSAISLDALPLAPVTDNNTAKANFAALLPWIDVAAARRVLSAADRVVGVLAAAKRTFDIQNPAATFDADLSAALTALTGWKKEFIQTVRRALILDTKVTSTTGRSVLTVSAFADAAGLRQVINASHALIRLGLNPDDVVAWSKKPVNSGVATKLRASLKGRYAPSGWRRVAQPIFDGLRKKQRDALVAYLTHLHGAPYGETQEKLFEHLLLDSGAEPPVLASRIQLAISSVQLFVQRCLMNLEPDVSSSIIDAKRWQWMSRYRVWEVNRKFFLWPENWLDPEFRDDRTHLFRELEGALLQGDVSDDLVRTALYSYLQGLEAIARLEMMTMYFEPGASADSSTVHVVGRTPNAPYKYFYRRCSHRMWTPWEPLGVDIEGEHLALTIWRGRMHLFWVTFFEKANEKGARKHEDGTEQTFQEMGDSASPGALKADRAVQLQLNWVEQVQGKWVNRSSTQTFLDAVNFNNKGASDPESKRNFSVHVKVDSRDTEELGDDILELHISHTSGAAQKFVMFSKLAPPRLENTGTSPAPGAMSGSALLAARATKWFGEPPLSVTFTANDVRKDGALLSSHNDAFRILEQGAGYSLLFPSNEVRIEANETIPRATGKPSGYIFAPQGAQHVVYRGTDRSIHDVWWTPNGWFHTNASAVADSEPATSDPHGYPLDDQHLHCIAYIAETKLLELSWSQVDSLGPDADEDVATAWRVDTLFEAAVNAPKPAGRPFGGVFTPKRGVVYRLDPGGALWAATEGTAPGSWDRMQLNGGTIPPAASDPDGVVMTTTSSGVTTVTSRHVFYRGTDGNLHELRSDATGKVWSHTNLTAATNSPPPAANTKPGAYAFVGQKTLHVVYRDQDGTVHELWGTVGSWNHNPIGAAFGKAEGDPTGYVTEFAGTQHVVYRGKDQNIHELWWSSAGWQKNVLTLAVSGAPTADGDPAGYSFERQSTQHVVYRAQDGGLRELWWDRGGWHLGRYELASPYVDPIGPLISPFFYEDEMEPYTFFVEPSLAEKTVHDWEEYIITTEEYVRDKPPINIGIQPHFPGQIRITPSELGVLTKARLGNDRLLAEGVLVNTRKGLFGPDGSVKMGTPSTAMRLISTGQIQIVDAALGSMKNTSQLVGKFRSGGIQ